MTVSVTMRAVLLLLATFLLFHCEKGNPVLNENAQISISVDPNVVLNFGDTAIVTVRAFEADGRPVLDGARIQLTATAGTITGEVRTSDGIATAIYTSGATAETVTITAQSGSIASDGSITTTIEVLDRDVEVSGATLSANPSNIANSGGNVDLRLVVFGPDNEPLANKPVVFSADFGQMANNGAITYTNSSGLAYDRLTLSNIPDNISQIQVSAQAGSLNSTATITVTSNQTPSPIIIISPESPSQGQDVFFNGATSTDSDGTITSYLWDFGDGQTASGASVSHSFTQARTYNIILTVTDDLGASASTTTALTIGANQPPIADFSISPENPRINEPVFFDGRNSSDPDGSISSYEWFLGNGSTRSGSTTSFAYPGANTYIVTLVVTDNGGATHALQKTLTISGNSLPTADFISSPLNPRINQVVTFDATPSSDSDGQIVDYSWDFGNFQGGRGQSAVNIYQEAGTYEVLLTVTDNDGGTAFANRQITVGDNTAPAASFTMTPSAPNVGQTVFFDGSGSSDGDGQIEEYFWQFGDGTFGSGTQASHVYTAAGDYQVALRVRDNDNLQGVASQVLRVQNGSVPTAALTASPNVLEPPTGYVLLDASGSSDNEDPLSQLTFSFQASSPNHVITDFTGGSGPLRQLRISGLQEGDTVGVLVTVTDTDGNSNSATTTIRGVTSSSNQVPNAVLSLDLNSLQPPGGTVILNGSNSSDGDHAIDDLSFNFSAQTTGNVVVEINGTGPVRNAVITDAVAGDTVTLRLNVSDPLGAQDSAFVLLPITEAPLNNPPNASFSIDPSGTVNQQPTANDPIRFVLDASTSSDNEDNINDLVFSFDSDLPNNASIVWNSSQIPYVRVAEVRGAVSGDLLVFTLRVTDSEGDEDFAFVEVTVTDP